MTGFQVSCADLDISKRLRGIKGPFILLKAEDMLYGAVATCHRETSESDGRVEPVGRIRGGKTSRRPREDGSSGSRRALGEAREGGGRSDGPRLLFRIVGTLAMPFVLAFGSLQGAREAIRIWWGAMKADDVEAFLRSQRKGK